MRQTALSTHLAVSEFALADDWQVLCKNSFGWIKNCLSIRSTATIHSLQELPDRLLRVDALLHIARGEMHLVRKLWQRALDELLNRVVLFLRGRVRRAYGEEVRDQLR